MSEFVGTWLPYPENKPPFDEERLVLTEDGWIYLAELWEDILDIHGGPRWQDLERGTVKGVTHYAEVNRMGRR